MTCERDKRDFMSDRAKKEFDFGIPIRTCSDQENDTYNLKDTHELLHHDSSSCGEDSSGMIHSRNTSVDLPFSKLTCGPSADLSERGADLLSASLVIHSTHFCHLQLSLQLCLRHPPNTSHNLSDRLYCSSRSV